MRSAVPTILLALAAFVQPLAAQEVPANDPGELAGTFSIIGRNPETGELGIAVQSRTIAVGARTRGGKGGVAVFAHQASSNPMYSDLGIELLERGMSPQETLDFLLRADNGGENRQVAILDIQGRTAAHTGARNSEWRGHRCGVDYCAQGNTLAGPEVVEAMADAFENAEGTLAERLVTALEAGQAAGGDRRGQQSAALMIYRPRSISDYDDRAMDLRVDEHETPIAELRRILTLRTPPRGG
jgi:uncharacterized Ntn-hydrolase superfamily protein